MNLKFRISYNAIMKNIYELIKVLCWTKPTWVQILNQFILRPKS